MGASWTFDREVRPRYFAIGDPDYDGDRDERTLSRIEATTPTDTPVTFRPLRHMARVIRTKDAGVNRLTYDILFVTEADYRAALDSGVFAGDTLTGMLPVTEDHLVGSYHVDTCNAIKISIDRPIVSAFADERDVFGAQQQAEFIRMSVPVPAQAGERNGVV